MDAVHAMEVAYAAQVPCGASIEIDVESCGSPSHHGWKHQVVCDQDWTDSSTTSEMASQAIQAKRSLGARNITIILKKNEDYHFLNIVSGSSISSLRPSPPAPELELEAKVTAFRNVSYSLEKYSIQLCQAVNQYLNSTGRISYVRAQNCDSSTRLNLSLLDMSTNYFTTHFYLMFSSDVSSTTMAETWFR